MPASTAHCVCDCGTNYFELHGEPLLRAVCHCHYCQEFNQASCGDFLIYRRRDVTVDRTASTDYRAFKKPEFVKRGSCTECGKPVNEKVNIPLLPELVFVPAVNHPQSAALPEAKLHMFYHRRKSDVHDQAPKYRGYLWSEANFMIRLIGGLLSR